MQLEEWLAQTNQILFQAQQDMPTECVDRLRLSQQFLMANHLQSGFLTIDAQTPLERAMNANPFAKIGLGS